MERAGQANSASRVMNAAMKMSAFIVFAFQATGASWFAHVTAASDGGPDSACSCGRIHAAAWPMGDPQGKGGCDHHRPGPPVRHDTGHCDLCKALLGLAAVVAVAPACPAIEQARTVNETPSASPALGIAPGSLGSRAPPARIG